MYDLYAVISQVVELLSKAIFLQMLWIIHESDGYMTMACQVELMMNKPAVTDVIENKSYYAGGLKEF